MSATENLPAEIDTKLAELYYQGHKLDAARNSRLATILHMAGARYYYRGRQRVTDMTEEQAIEILSADLTKRDLSARQTHGEALEALEAADIAIMEHDNTTFAVAAKYTGWSRFFLVTSSTGHIHSSMHCSTCRPTTRYGWLPQLSGQTEAQAVAECGPALCSVCFPSAPLDWQGQKLSKKQADDILAGRTVTAEPKKEYCPGSGQQVLNPRRNYAGVNGSCPHCHKHVSGGQTGAARKHKEEKPS